MKKSVLFGLAILMASWVQAAPPLPDATVLTLQEAAGRHVFCLYYDTSQKTAATLEQFYREINEMETFLEKRDGSDRVTVLVDGVLMEIPYWALIGGIRSGIFVVVSGWDIDLVIDVGEVDCEKQPFHPNCLGDLP